MSEELNKEIAPEPVEEEIQEATVTATTREEIIARLQEMVGDISLAKRPELESLKQNFYKLQRAAQEEQIAAFVAGGGTAQDFKPEPDPLEEQFRKLMNIIRRRKLPLRRLLRLSVRRTIRRNWNFWTVSRLS